MDYQSILNQLNADLEKQHKELHVSLATNSISHENNIQDYTEKNETMNFCPNCGADIDLDFPFCPMCGFELEQKEEDMEDYVEEDYEDYESKEVLEPEMLDFGTIAEVAKCVQKLKTKQRLNPIDGMEETSSVKLRTFNTEFDHVFQYDSGIQLTYGNSDSSTTKPKLDYCGLVIYLQAITEIECRLAFKNEIYTQVIPKLIIADKKNRTKKKRNYDEWSVAFYDVIKYVIRNNNDNLKQYFTAKEIENLRGILNHLRNRRNDAGHPNIDIYTLKMFECFYDVFVDFYQNYLPRIIALKKESRKNNAGNYSYGDSFDTDLRFDDTYEDYEYPNVTGQNITNNEQKNTIVLERTRPDNVEFCVILTNSKRLGIKYCHSELTRVKKDKNTIIDIDSKDLIIGQILYYASILEQHTGYKYDILDISDSKFGQIEGNTRTWQKTLVILDIYCRANDITHQSPVHLLIYGGDDVVEMPCLNSPCYKYEKPDAQKKQILEKDVHTDYIYSFEGNQINVEGNELDWSKIKNKPPRFFVSRLPLESNLLPDSDYERDFIREDCYFARLAQMWEKSEGQGTKINNTCFAACESAVNTLNVLVEEHFDIEKDNEAGVMRKGIFISPDVDLDIENETDINTAYKQALRNSDFALFMCHGSNNPSLGLTGEPLPNNLKDNMSAQTTEDDVYEKGLSNTLLNTKLQKEIETKIIVAMSCWGARFVNYPIERSLVLTGLNQGNNLAYLGSSRSSYGYFDYDVFRVNENKILKIMKSDFSLCSGQLLLSQFCKYMLQGLSLAKALALAKWDILDLCYTQQDSEKHNTSIYRLTLLQFNLFGDPFVRVQPLRKPENDQKMQPKTFNIAKEERVTIYSRQEGDIITTAKTPSLLDRVRGLVNSNISDIRNRITKNLYEQYGLKPQHLELMNKITDEKGNNCYELLYQNPDVFSDGHIAFVDGNGKVLDLESKY